MQILNLKINEAVGKGITVSKSILIPHDLSISFSDVVAVLGNVFDNAIEACKRDHVKEPLIYFKMQYVDGMLFIEIKNSIGYKPEAGKSLLSSRKNDAVYHGLGLKNVRHIIEKYSGTMNVDIEDNCFVNKIVLYGIQTKNDKVPM